MPGSGSASGDGEVREASRGEAIARAAETPHIILNAPLVGQRLGYPELSGLDLLELFAFIHPARFAVPTAAGLSRALGLEPPASEAEAAAALQRDRRRGCSRCSPIPTGASAKARGPSNATLHRLGWGWAPLIGARLERPERGERMLFSRLTQWEEAAERPPPRTVLVDPGASAGASSTQLTGRRRAARGPAGDGRGGDARCSRPKRAKGAPNLLLAEAGTGIGKTLAYLAPASLWAEQAGGAVWVSTFTKALQRQLDAEGPKLFADADERSAADRRPQGPRELSLPAQPRGRAAGRVRRAAPRSSRSWSGAGRPTPRTATWSAATCRAGCRACSAAPARPR